MKSRMFFLTLLIISVFWILDKSAPVFARKAKSSSETLKKEQIIRSINFLRAKQKQRPLTLSNFDKIQVAGQTLNVAGNQGAIAGNLYDISGDYFYAAVVVAWSTDSTSNSATANFAEVGRDGSYYIDKLDSGDYYVVALADGYIPKFYDNVTNFSEATPVHVSADSVIKSINFKMERFLPGTASISGLVLSEEDSTAIGKATISAFSLENPFLYGWAASYENGSYHITGLNDGKYYVTAWAGGYLTEYYLEAANIENATPIEVVEPNEYSDINFTLSRGGSISGVVTNDDGVAIAGAYVEAMSDSIWNVDSTYADPDLFFGYGAAVTNDRGEYIIGGLQTGNYIVVAHARAQWYYAIEWYDNVLSPEDATPVLIQASKEVSGINFQLSVPIESGEIVGKVTDLQGQPLESAYVQAQSPFQYPEEGVKVWAYAYTDREGNYRIKNLPNGRYLVSVSAQSGWQFVQRWWPDAETPDQAEPVIVDSNIELKPTNFKLPISMGQAAISGTVLSSSGLPITSAYIQISPQDLDPSGSGVGTWAYAYSDSSGYYQVDNLPAGTYVAHAQYWQDNSFGQQWYDHADSLANATPIVLVDGDDRRDVNFELTLRPFYGAIAGTVTDEESGSPISRAYVEITYLDKNYLEYSLIRFWPFYAISDDQGKYQLDWLPEGEYLVSVYANGAFEYYENAVVPEQAKAVKVTGGSTTDINFGLTPRNEGSGIISGRVMSDWTDELLEMAVVIARPVVVPLVWPDSEMFFNAIINPDGTYEISGLPSGEFYIFCFAPGYIGEYYDNVYDPVDAKYVKVDETNPVTDINFSLAPMLILRADMAEGSQNGATLYGKVTDSNDSAIYDATIYLLNDTEQPFAFARTNAEGMYEINNVAPGQYRLKASQVGYQSEFNNNAGSFTEAVPMEIANGRIEVNFTLETKTVTDVPSQPDLNIPESIELYGNFPNPFNPETRISFGLPAEMRVQLTIFNLLGQEVAQLYDDVLGPGKHNIIWNGRNQFGQTMTSGIYFYALQANGQRIAVSKMTLLK